MDDGSRIDIHRIQLTASGWERFDELTRTASSPKNPVFVAMWFGVAAPSAPDDIREGEMRKVYEDGIQPAIELAGYCATRVDLEHFNDGIMDRVFGDIRVAPFVVADLTGHRNGVYLEAGFARGLGHPVIHTCMRSHFDKTHFDVRHLNIILWGDTGELRELLFQRIRGSFGLGPFARGREGA